MSKDKQTDEVEKSDAVAGQNERLVMCGDCPYCSGSHTASVSPPYFALNGGRDDEVVESLMDCLDCEKSFVIMYTEKRSAGIGESTRF